MGAKHARILTIQELRAGARARSLWISRPGSQYPQEFLFIYAVLKCLAAIDEDHRNLVVELPEQFRVGVDVNLLQAENNAAARAG